MGFFIAQKGMTMKPYQKNYAPKSRQEVAGANDHLWISNHRNKTVDKETYDRNYERAFGHK